MSDELKRGLEGVLVAESDLSYVDGEVGKLVYRGYDIEDLARGASYEEVLYLLWRGSLPTREELDAFTADLAAERAVDDDALDAVRTLADAGERPMAALRTAVSMLSAYEPESDADPRISTRRSGRAAGSRRRSRRFLAAFERARQGEDPVAPDPDLSHAANFLYMLTGTEPDDVSAETFDMALTLHADHGLNASTFTDRDRLDDGRRVLRCHRRDRRTLRPLHGGANQDDVMEVLQEVDASDKDPVQWVKDAREEGRRIPGFGHRVYKVKDPRAKIRREAT